MNLIESEKTLSVCTNAYDWCNPFDITTIGIAGTAECKWKKDKIENEQLPIEIKWYQSSRLDLGVVISSLTYPWEETKTITFIPWFILFNATHWPIVISQAHNDSS